MPPIATYNKPAKNITIINYHELIINPYFGTGIAIPDIVKVQYAAFLEHLDKPLR